MNRTDTVAHVGDSLLVHDEVITLTNSLTVSANKCVSDLFVIDGAFLNTGQEGTAKIKGIDVFEEAGSLLAKSDFKYFLANEEWSTPTAQGSTFSYSGLSSNIVAMIVPTNTYNDVSTLKSMAQNAMNVNVKSGTTTRLFCQVLANTSVTFSAGTKLYFRFYIARD